jgi:phage terminase small subunit
MDEKPKQKKTRKPHNRRISNRQEELCLIYAANGGNVTDAAKQMGIGVRYVHQMLTHPLVQDRIKELTKEVTSPKIATAIERQEFWTSVMYGHLSFADEEKGTKVVPNWNERIKASELLGRSQGQFLDKKEISGADGGPLSIKVVFQD